MEILINSSKTMRAEPAPGLRKPALLKQAKVLAAQLKTYDQAELKKMMHISPKLAVETEQLLTKWTAAPQNWMPTHQAAFHTPR